jgi:hypothetical protein
VKKLLVVIAILTSVPAVAGKVLEVDLEEVRPTQAVVGLDWVGKKIEKFDGMSLKEIQERLEDKPAPAVIGPGGEIYLLDDHHDFLALLELGVTQAYVDIQRDYSDLSHKEFEQKMIEKNWVYFGNADGALVYSMATLPVRLKDLKNDSHRTLASMLRRADGFRKNGDTHIEFAWANALRGIVSVQMIGRNPEKAVELALEFAWSKAAKGLPGYIGSSKRRTCEQELERRDSP